MKISLEKLMFAPVRNHDFIQGKFIMLMMKIKGFVIVDQRIQANAK